MKLVNVGYLLILAFAHMVVDMYVGFLMPLLPALEVRLGVSFAALAGVVGLCGIIVNLIQPVAAKFSSSFPHQLFLIIGPVISGVLAFIGVVETYEGFVVLSIISVIGTGIFHPDGVIAAHAASGDHEHLGVPIFLSGGFFGFSSGAIISSQWFMNYDFEGYWLLALPGVICTFLIFAIRNKIRYDEPLGSDAPAVEEDSKKGFHIFTLVSLAFCLVTPVAVLYTLYSKYLEVLFGEDTAIEWSGFVLALLGISSAAGSYFWGWISKKYSRYLLVCFTQLAAIIVYLLFIYAEPGVWLVIVSLLLGVSWGSTIFPVVATAAKSARGLTPAERAGWVVGGSWGVAGLFQMLSGWATSWGGGIVSIIKYPVIFMIFALFIAFWMWKRERSEKLELSV